MRIKIQNKEFIPFANKFKEKLSATLCRSIPKGKRKVTVTLENNREFWVNMRGNIEVENETGIYWYYFQGDYDKVFERIDVALYKTGEQLAVKI